MANNGDMNRFECRQCMNPCTVIQSAESPDPSMCHRGGKAKWLHMERFNPERIVMKEYVLEIQELASIVADEVYRAKTLKETEKDEIFRKIAQIQDNTRSIIINYIDNDMVRND